LSLVATTDANEALNNGIYKKIFRQLLGKQIVLCVPSKTTLVKKLKLSARFVVAFSKNIVSHAGIRSMMP
jgi:hypothetical protein